MCIEVVEALPRVLGSSVRRGSCQRLEGRVRVLRGAPKHLRSGLAEKSGPLRRSGQGCVEALQSPLRPFLPLPDLTETHFNGHRYSGEPIRPVNNACLGVALKTRGAGLGLHRLTHSLLPREGVKQVHDGMTIVNLRAFAGLPVSPKAMRNLYCRGL